MTVFPQGTLIWQIFTNVSCLRTYYGKRDGTRLIYERLVSTNTLREKRRDSFDPQRENLLGEESICMVNLLGTPRVIVFFFFFIT